MTLDKIMTTKTKNSRKNVARSPRIRYESGTNPQPIRTESGTNPQPIRYAFVPLLQQFRSHTKKNEARLWLPIETSLLTRYEFAALSPQTRYAFVAILLYCGANGINEIPLDTKFMANVLIIDSRTIEKSFDELLFANLLQERKKEEKRKEQTDRQDAREIALDARLCVDDFNSFSESRNGNGKSEEGLLTEDSSAHQQTAKIFEIENGKANHSNGNNQSKFSIEECKRYVELEIKDGATIQNANALAMKLFKTGQSDAFIFNKLFPKEAAVFAAQSYGEAIEFSDEPCSVCFGAKMADADGKGHRACLHCKNERGKSTGYEPEQGGK